MNILEKMELRKRVLAEKKEKGIVSAFSRKYRQTGDKKYLHFLSGITGQGDYLPSDMGNEPNQE